MPARKPPPWTQEEIAILDEIYPAEGINGVTDLLPERSWQAIYVMASKRGLRSSVVTEAPRAKLQGDRLERAIMLREETGWSFARIGVEFGISEAAANNAVLAALCLRRGHRPAERDARGRLLPAGIERLRYALRKGYKGVDIQIRLGLSAGRVAEERRRYNRELKANGKALLPPPGGGEAYSGVKISRAKLREVEELLLQGFGTLKVSLRAEISKTTVTRIRNRLIARLRRKGEILPGCDIEGVRRHYVDHRCDIPPAAIAEFRRLLLDERMSAARAGIRSGIGGSSAHGLRTAIAREFAASGQQLPQTRRLGRGAASRRELEEDRRYPRGKAEMIAWRHYAAEQGYPAARQKLEDDRAAKAAVARAESRRPKTFEEQLAAVAAGATLVTRVDLRRPDPAMTLGGVATGAL